jgi:hypothetical protein
MREGPTRNAQSKSLFAASRIGLAFAHSDVALSDMAGDGLQNH